MGGNFRIDPKQQFSKKLARWTAVFWFIYMGWLCTILFLAPEAGLYTVYMSIVISIVMILNIYQYNSNSKLEKILLAILSKTEMQLKIGDSTMKTGGSSGSEEDEYNG